MLDDEKKLDQNEGSRKLLNKEHEREMAQILAFGEKYKQEGEKMEYEFWSSQPRSKFNYLLEAYETSKEKVIESLPLEEKNMLSRLDPMSKEMFYKKCLYKKIIYSGGNVEHKRKQEQNMDVYYTGKSGDLKSFRSWARNVKNYLKPGMKIDLGNVNAFNGGNNPIGPEGAKILAEEWKDDLQPGMHINLVNDVIGDEGIKAIAKAWKGKLQSGMRITLENNDIGDEGIKILAEEWKDSLQPGMTITLGNNNFGKEGLRILTETWKNNLKPGMKIGLGNNGLGYEGAEILAKGRKGKLQPGMIIDLSHNYIGDEGLKALTEEWKGLPSGFVINLEGNGISDKGVQYIMDNWELNGGVKISLFGDISPKMEEKLENWVQKKYKDKGINCEVLV